MNKRPGLTLVGFFCGWIFLLDTCRLKVGKNLQKPIFGCTLNCLVEMDVSVSCRSAVLCCLYLHFFQ